MSVVFVDTNIFARHFTGDHPIHSPRATAFLQQVIDGQIEATTSAYVLIELEHILASVYRIDRSRIAEMLRSIVELPSIRLPNRATLLRAIETYLNRNVDLVDALIALDTEDRGIDTVITFDKHFNRFPSLTRKEP